MAVHGFTFSSVAFAVQLALLILFVVFVRYENRETSSLGNYYPLFQDVHVMIFIGFGFLMTFLRKYGYGAVGYNMFISAVVIQWATLLNAWLANAAEGHFDGGKVRVNVITLITSDFAAGAVLITFGAVLGKVSRLQLLLIGVFEVVFYAINETVLNEYVKAADVGGSMVIHMFGAYFGLALSRVLMQREWLEENDKESSNYHSDLFSMIGTVFLWMFWPSFNGAVLGPGLRQNRALVNTYYSLAACCMMTFVISPLVNKGYKISMVHIQNATLAGGVAVGTMADLMIEPWGAVLVGIFAGTLSTLGFTYVQPFLLSKLNLHDTCGVNNLHGMPAFIAAIGGAVAAAVADSKDYGSDLYAIWPARLPVKGSAEYLRLNMTSAGGDGRRQGTQGGYQMVAIAATLGIAIVGGVITGLIVKLLDTPKGADVFDDASFWELSDHPVASSGNTTTVHLAPKEVNGRYGALLGEEEHVA